MNYEYVARLYGIHSPLPLASAYSMLVTGSVVVSHTQATSSCSSARLLKKGAMARPYLVQVSIHTAHCPDTACVLNSTRDMRELSVRNMILKEVSAIHHSFT